MYLFKKIFFFAGLLLFTRVLSGYAQNRSESLLKKAQLKGNIDIPGANISYEKRLGKSVTAYFDGGLTYGFVMSSGLLYDGKRFGYELAPIISASLRKYYNLEKRAYQGRNVQNNAANFINLKLGYRFAPIASKNMYANPVIAIEPSWGLQRNIGQHFSLEVAPGFAFLYDTRERHSGGNVTLKLRFGYVIL